jgi:hypothetical protein
LKFLFSALLITNSAVAIAQLAEFSFDEKVFKSRPVAEGALIEHTFWYTNSGSEPLIITHFEVACECTKAFYSSEPVLPGKQGSIRVTFDTKGKIGWQYRGVQIFANTPKNPTEIEIRVKVEPPKN